MTSGKGLQFPGPMYPQQQSIQCRTNQWPNKPLQPDFYLHVWLSMVDGKIIDDIWQAKCIKKEVDMNMFIFLFFL